MCEKLAFETFASSCWLSYFHLRRLANKCWQGPQSLSYDLCVDPVWFGPALGEVNLLRLEKKLWMLLFQVERNFGQISGFHFLWPV